MANKESRAQQALQPRVPDPNLKLPSGPLTGPGAAAGPLVVSVANPRYFTVASGNAVDRKVVYLTGSHIWNNLHDGLGPGTDCAATPEQNAYPRPTPISSRTTGTHAVMVLGTEPADRVEDRRRRDRHPQPERELRDPDPDDDRLDVLRTHLLMDGPSPHEDAYTPARRSRRLPPRAVRGPSPDPTRSAHVA